MLNLLEAKFYYTSSLGVYEDDEADINLEFNIVSFQTKNEHIVQADRYSIED